MPPALSENGSDAASGAEEEFATPPRDSRPKRKSISASNPVDDDPASDLDDEDIRNGPGNKEDEDEEDEDEGEGEGLDEDEFIVEAIKKHMIDEDGTLKFHVKWEGYESKTDLTWEPEDNLKESASEALEEYFRRIGGRDQIFEDTDKAKTKKRRRGPNGTAKEQVKRSRKNATHPSEGSPPATAKKWSPPAGSWEDEIETIDACEDEGSGQLVVYLIWKNGSKTKHNTSVIYKKCPQKMLQFYERHVKIIRDENKALADEVEA